MVQIKHHITHHKKHNTAADNTQQLTSNSLSPPPSPPPPLPLLLPPKMMSASEASDNNISEDVLGHMAMPDFEALAWDIQNLASCCVGAATMETRHFHEFFGTSVLVIEKTWELLKRDSLLQEGGRPKHLL
jgi:hypothetical protein